MSATRKVLTAAIWAAVSVVAAGCSVQLAQTSAAPTPTTAAATATRISTATTVPPTETAVPTATSPGDELLPTATIAPSPTGQGLEFPLLDGSVLDYEPMPGWEGLGLSGKALFLAYGEFGQAVVVFDFESGEFAPVFVSPENTWVLAASLSADRRDMVIAYAPPPQAGETQFGYSDLYFLPPAGAPEPLLKRAEAVEAYFSSFYSYDGDFIYYSWFVTDENVSYGFRYHIGRLNVSTGEAAVVVEDAFWQSVSRDGQRLAYVTFDPNAAFDDPAELFVVDTATWEGQAVLDTAVFPTIDAPFFSPDRTHLYFSAVSMAPTTLSWLDRLFGVRIASAHNVPSDWWRVDLATGVTERITEVFDQGMFGAFSPDGDWIAYISSTGLWVMRPDGSGLIQVLDSASFYGNLEWLR